MKNNPKIIILFGIVVCLGCTTEKRITSSRNGSYKVERYKSSSLSKSIVFGCLYDNKTKLPIPYPRIKLSNSIQFKADITGKYRFSIKPGKYVFVGAGMPYEFLSTNPVKVNLGDSIKIDYYLQQDTTPLIEKN